MRKETFFYIVIPSYNNEKYVEKNLRSVASQTYKNYQVIYIDDASEDRTALLAKREILQGEVVENKERMGAMHNVYHALKKAPKESVAVLLDGDDWLSHDGVLALLNKVYQEEDVWLTFGQYVTYPEYKKGPLVPRRSIDTPRDKPWFLTPLRTFYVALFQKIAKEDLLHEGSFVSVAHDMALMFPMLEMAGERARWMEEVLYVYNCENPLAVGRDRGRELIAMDSHLRGLSPYPRLERLEV